jgi:glycosyltransferase involved in cell wall biosynthesis
MKAAVFFDSYLPYHEGKDPGLIPLGLNRIGCDTFLVTLTKPQLTGYKPPFSLIPTERERLFDVEFWRHLDAEVVICYTWLQPSYNPLLEKIVAGGKKIVLKLDSDGRLGYPAMPRYVQDSPPDLLRDALSWFRRTRVYGRLSSRFRKKYRALMLQKLEQIRLSSTVIVESPKALANISRILDYWSRSDLQSKLQFVPDPVAEDVLAASTRNKRNLAISVGRWADSRKNVHTLLRCANRFLATNPEWNLRVLGEGQEIVKKTVSTWPRSLASRVEISGIVPHSKVAELLADSRIFFAPSSSESWGMAAAEATCMGCTIVGTPLESFEYLAADGFSGTLSEGFASRQISRALELDVVKHAQGAYDPVEIARHWRSKLSIDQVSSQICEIIGKL